MTWMGPRGAAACPVLRVSVAAGGWWRRAGACRIKEGLGRPGHQPDSFVARELGDVGQPGEGLDADGAADREGQLVDRLVRESVTQRRKGLLDPADGPALPQRQRGALDGISF